MGIDPQRNIQRKRTLAERISNQLVRSYLRQCLITEGKSLLLNLTKDWIIPEAPIVIFETKYPLEVLRGGEHCLKTHAPLLMAELKDVGETNRDDFSEIEKYITNLGYSLYEIGKYALKRCAHIADSKRRNFFLANEDSRAFSRISPWLS